MIYCLYYAYKITTRNFHLLDTVSLIMISKFQVPLSKKQFPHSPQYKSYDNPCLPIDLAHMAVSLRRPKNCLRCLKKVFYKAMH